MYNRNKVIEIAKAEVGYRETGENITKYAAELDATAAYNGAKNGFAWCDMFVDWCFYKAFGYEAMLALTCQPEESCGAGCTYSLEYYRKAGRFDTHAEIGAQIFYGEIGDSQHTGLVYNVDDAYVYTVEGNYADSVCKVRHRLDDDCIAGYGHPEYDDDVGETAGAHTGAPLRGDGESEDCTVQLPTLQKNSTGGYVKTVQIMLEGRGYDCGVCGVDGELGDDTQFALCCFQTDEGLTVDGVCAVETWRALLRC